MATKLTLKNLDMHLAPRDGVAVLLRVKTGKPVIALQTVERGAPVAVAFDDGGWSWFNRAILDSVKGARRYVRKTFGVRAAPIVQIDTDLLPIDVVALAEVEAK